MNGLVILGKVDGTVGVVSIFHTGCGQKHHVRLVLLELKK